METQEDKLKAQLQEKQFLIDELMDSTMAGWWDWNIPDEKEYLSPGFKKMFGYEDHEMENTPDAWQKIIHQDDLPGVFDVFNKHIKSKGKIPYDNTVRYRHKDGSVVWVYCRGKVIEWAEDGSPIRMIGTHVDVTKEKNMTEQLKEQNDELEKINDLMVDRELKIVELKKEIEKLSKNK